MQDDIEKVLLSRQEISEAVSLLGARISEDFAGKCPLLISVLKGSVVFMADLMRAITVECTIDFMAVSSYGHGTKTTGAVKILKDLDTNPENMHVIIIEDILDSGVTLSYLREFLQRRNPASITIATLLDKPERRTADIAADYRCFTVPDEFVVGYGLDYADKYRNLPYVGVLKPEIYLDSQE